MPPLLEARRLQKRFGARVVLEDVSLGVEAGQLVGIMGPNGAGKTTLFNVLTGRHRPDRGRVLLGGEDVTGLPPRLIARKGIARSFQLMNLFDSWSALDNVLIALPETRARGFEILAELHADRAAVDKAAAVLERVGLGGKGNGPAGGLSYGDRRALEIAVALAAEPKVLCLDEPTSGLGTAATVRLAGLVRELKGRYGLIVIEHDMRFLFSLADRIAVIHWGQVIAEGTPDELVADPWVRASRLGEAAA